MTIDTRVAARFQARTPAWRLGAAATAAVGVVLTAWALSVDFPKASGGFAGDAATYYTLGHSLAHDFDFEFRRDDLVRVAKKYVDMEHLNIVIVGDRSVIEEGLRKTGIAPIVRLDIEGKPIP